MSNPRGNPGNKGGGRKSAYEEERVAKIIKEAFVNGFDLERVQEIQKLMKKKKGKLNFTDLALARAIKSDRLLRDLLKKLVPDKQHIEHEGAVPTEPVKIEIVKPKK